MTRSARVTGFGTLALLALTPLAAQAQHAAAPAICHAGFEAPARPMHFTRELRRSLFDGKELVVIRHYTVTFTPTPTGFRVDGTSAGTDVAAPERLAPLAELERKRPDTSMFPLTLDRTGQIVQSSERGPDIPGKAQPLADGLIAGAGLKGLAQEQAAQFVDRLVAAQGPGINQWPALLFRPGNRPMEAHQELPLPGGGKGMVSITLDPEAAGPCALMQRLERKVETVVGTQVRRTREIWTLSPAP